MEQKPDVADNCLAKKVEQILDFVDENSAESKTEEPDLVADSAEAADNGQHSREAIVDTAAVDIVR